IFTTYFLDLYFLVPLIKPIYTAYKNNYRPVYHYLIVFAVFIFINMVSILSELGVYEKSVHTQHASLVGAGFLVIIFGVGLANRITALKEEKERKEQENNLMEQSLKLSQ